MAIFGKNKKKKKLKKRKILSASTKEPKASKFVTGFTILVLLLFFLFIFVGGVILSRGVLFKNNHHFVIKHIVINNDNIENKQNILKLLKATETEQKTGKIIPGVIVCNKTNMFDLDLSAVIKRLKKNKYIYAIKVSRKIPDTIVINCETYQPVASIFVGKVFHVSSEGLVLPYRKEFAQLRLPNIVGIKLAGDAKYKEGDVVDDYMIKSALHFLKLVREKLGGKYFDVQQIYLRKFSYMPRLDIYIRKQYVFKDIALIKMPVKDYKKMDEAFKNLVCIIKETIKAQQSISKMDATYKDILVTP